MPFPISLIAGWLVDKGMKEAKAGPVAWVIAIIIAIIAIVTAYNLWVDDIIDRHETEQSVDRLETTLERGEAADDDARGREDRDAKEIEDLKDGARDAEIQDPEGARQPVGPVTSDTVDRLRDSRRRQPSS